LRKHLKNENVTDTKFGFIFQAHAVSTAAGAPVFTGTAAAHSSKSVIDLTDDDDANTPAPATKGPQVFVLAPTQTASMSALTLPSLATVVKSVRSLPPPPLHIAPSHQPRLQVLVGDENKNKIYNLQDENRKENNKGILANGIQLKRVKVKMSLMPGFRLCSENRSGISIFLYINIHIFFISR